MGPISQGPAALTGRVIAGYRLERVLGSGGTGIVYLGRRVDAPHNEAALKLLVTPLQLSPAERAEFQERFRREAQILLTLRHPHILSVQAFGDDSSAGFSYMVLPYLQGGTLATRLTQGLVPLNEAADYLTQLADALDYAHQHGVVHRGIKPGNVLLDAQG